MLSKYEVSAKSALDIESVVGELMEELGVGGFMGVQDVKSGMKISLVLNTDKSGSVFFVNKDLPSSHVDHRFDREYHTWNQKHPCPLSSEMANLRFFMELQSDTMTA